MTADQPSAVRVAAIRGKGRGVVAARELRKDEVILRDPVIVIPAEEWRHVQKTVVRKFCFVWHEGRDDAALALGHGSLFNHSATPNARAWTCLRERVIEFIALRDIEAGEEITLNYNADGVDRPLGFRVRKGSEVLPPS